MASRNDLGAEFYTNPQQLALRENIAGRQESLVYKSFKLAAIGTLVGMGAGMAGGMALDSAVAPAADALGASVSHSMVGSTAMLGGSLGFMGGTALASLTTAKDQKLVELDQTQFHAQAWGQALKDESGNYRPSPIPADVLNMNKTKVKS
jgi:hypothetical protein